MSSLDRMRRRVAAAYRAQGNDLRQQGLTNQRRLSAELGVQALNLERAMNRENMPVSTRVAMRQNTQQAMSSAMTSLNADTDARNRELLANRRQALDQIDYQIDLEREQKKREKKTDLANYLTAGLAGVGAVVGSVVPGVGTMAGASVGAGVGDVVGGLVGWRDTSSVLTGMRDVTNGVMGATTLKSERETVSLFRDNMDALNGMTSEQLGTFNAVLGLALNTGDMATVRELFSSLGAGRQLVQTQPVLAPDFALRSLFDNRNWGY